MIRTIAERLSRKRTWKRRLPVEFGRAPIYVSPDAQLKYLIPGRGGFDEGLLRLAIEELRVGDVVWDVGASVGVFSICAAMLAGRSGSVLAVEPDKWIADLLRQSAALPENRKLRVSILSVAVSNCVGSDELLIAKRGRASNALASVGGRDQMGGWRERLEVPIVTLDHLLTTYPAPTFVKIDVEGAETKVLEGGARMLSEVRPKIYIEVGPKSCDDITSMLRARQYVLFDPAVPRTTRAPIEHCVFNTLAVPAESAGG